MSNDQSSMGMPNGPALSWDELDRYLAGECSAEDAARIAQVLAQDPGGTTAMREYIRRAAGQAAPYIDVAESWTRMRAQLDVPGDILGEATSWAHDRVGGPVSQMRVAREHASVRTIPRRSWPTRLVVGMLVASVVCLAVYRIASAACNKNHDNSGIDGAQTRYATTIGQTATITLTDGSRVILAPHTTLLVPTAFSATTRTVTLDGEAYFMVRPSVTAPFLVRAGRATTRVLGTAFDVRHYATDRETQVAVTTGKVVVTGATAAHPSVTLVAGTVGVVTDSTAVLTSADSAARYTAWTTGMLVFRDVAATEILSALGRWYGYEFRVMDSTVVTQIVTAEFSTRSSSEALNNLKLVLNADLHIDGNVVTLRAERRSRHPVRERRQDNVVNPHTEVGR